jgi:hypothetical protein
LRTSVFDRTGSLLFERYAGLEVINEYEITGSNIETKVRTDLFQDSDLLDEAISLSFQPWLGPPLEVD